jgi:hypothetical protein
VEGVYIQQGRAQDNLRAPPPREGGGGGLITEATGNAVEAAGAALRFLWSPSPLLHGSRRAAGNWEWPSRNSVMRSIGAWGHAPGSSPAARPAGAHLSRYPGGGRPTLYPRAPNPPVAERSTGRGGGGPGRGGYPRDKSHSPFLLHQGLCRAPTALACSRTGALWLGSIISIVHSLHRQDQDRPRATALISLLYALCTREFLRVQVQSSSSTQHIHALLVELSKN